MSRRRSRRKSSRHSSRKGKPPRRRPAGEPLGEPAGVLVGLTLCLLLAGVARWFDSRFTIPAGGGLVAGVGLLCLAVGPLLATLPAGSGGRRWRDRLATPASYPQDRALLWTVLAVASLATGFAIVGLGLGLPVAESSHRWLEGRFLWPGGLKLIVPVATATAILLPAGAVSGLGLTALCRLAGRGRGWSLQPVGWCVVGGGLAWYLLAAPGVGGAAGRTALLGAALPVFVVAVLAVWRIGGRAGDDGTAGVTEPVSAPRAREDQPRLVRMSAVWLAACIGVVVLAWSRLWEQLPLLGDDPGPGAAILLLAGVAGGLLGGLRGEGSRLHSAGGLGVMCAAAGAGIAALVLIPAWWRGFDRLAAGPPVILSGVGLGSGVLLGCALRYAHLVVLPRAGSPAGVGASLLFVCLAAAGVALLAVAEVDRAARVAFVMLAAVALSMLALGGTIIIHEPAHSSRTRRARLAAILAAIAALVYVLPLAGRAWSARTPVSVSGRGDGATRRPPALVTPGPGRPFPPSN